MEKLSRHNPVAASSEGSQASSLPLPQGTVQEAVSVSIKKLAEVSAHSPKAHLLLLYGLALLGPSSQAGVQGLCRVQ